MDNCDVDPRIVADGRRRLLASDGFRKQLVELRDAVRARHAAELAQAGFFRRVVLRLRMGLELRRERRRIEPSADALFALPSGR